MNMQLAVFDLAGTTVNDPDGVNRCLRASLHAAGLDVERDAVNALMGIPKPEAICRLIEASNGHAELLSRIDQIHEDFARRMIEFYETDDSVYEIAGTSDVFARLNRAGIKVAVNTGFARTITQVILQRLGWERDGLVQADISSDEVPRGRPYPDMIAQLMKRFHIAGAQHVAKVGDTPADLQEGTNAGCGMVVGVTGGTHSREQLEAFPHTHLIASISEFPALLGL